VLTGILTGAGLISVAALTGRFISSLILKAII
jgi:hypothetical protein